MWLISEILNDANARTVAVCYATLCQVDLVFHLWLIHVKRCLAFPPTSFLYRKAPMWIVSRRVRRSQVLPLTTHPLSLRNKPRWHSSVLTQNRSTRACWLPSALEKLLPNWKGWVFIIASITMNSWYFLQNYHINAWHWTQLALAQSAAGRSLNRGNGGGEESLVLQNKLVNACVKLLMSIFSNGTHPIRKIPEMN